MAHTEHLIQNHEQNFRDIFSRLNKTVSISIFVTVMTLLVTTGGLVVGLLYNDIKETKVEFRKNQLAVTRELGEIKVLIAELK